jgi:hypothetical protein
VSNQKEIKTHVKYSELKNDEIHYNYNTQAKNDDKMLIRMKIAKRAAL